MRIRSWIAASLMLLTVDAAARQTIQASDGDTVAVRVSQTDLTRFRVEGGRIRRLLGANNVADVHTDDERGEIAIRPRVNTPFSFFLTTSSGDTFTVLATPVPIPSETVIISPRVRRDRQAELAPPPSTPHVRRIKRMIRAMTTGDRRYRQVTSRQEISLWRELQVTRVAVWPGSLVGEKYEVRNISGQEQRLSEREFGILGNDVVAVAIAQSVLSTDAVTEVYVIRRPED